MEQRSLTFHHVRHECLWVATDVKVFQATFQILTCMTFESFQRLVCSENQITKVGVSGYPYAVISGLDQVECEGDVWLHVA